MLPPEVAEVTWPSEPSLFVHVTVSMADDFKIAQPLQYYRKFLEKDVRPDGRELGESRSVVINIGYINSAEGSALVKTGNTAVICGIKAELAEPKTEEPKMGYIVPNLELSTLCSPQFRSGPPGEQAQICSQMLLNAIQNSKCLELTDLCIIPQKLVWVLYCDLICLDYDGNVMDSALLALVAALSNCMLPTVNVDEDSLEITTDFSKRVPLKLLAHPVATTFSIFDDDILLLDPCKDEEVLSSGSITVVTTGDKLCGVHKPGGAKVCAEKLQQCIERAVEQTSTMQSLLKKAEASLKKQGAKKAKTSLKKQGTS